eukprot:1266591-Rhodomonas_salina.2
MDAECWCRECTRLNCSKSQSVSGGQLGLRAAVSNSMVAFRGTKEETVGAVVAAGTSIEWLSEAKTVRQPGSDLMRSWRP